MAVTMPRSYNDQAQLHTLWSCVFMKKEGKKARRVTWRIYTSADRMGHYQIHEKPFRCKYATLQFSVKTRQAIIC